MVPTVPSTGTLTQPNPAHEELSAVSSQALPGLALPVQPHVAHTAGDGVPEQSHVCVRRSRGVGAEGHLACVAVGLAHWVSVGDSVSSTVVEMENSLV